MHRLSYCLFIVSSLFIGISHSTLASAESPRWYDIELALIGYQDSQKINHENWPEIIVEKQLINVQEDLPLTPQEDPWAWLNWWNNHNEAPVGLYNIQKKMTNTPSSLEIPFTNQGPAFVDKINKFEKTKGLQLVWSKKWRQPIPEKAKATLDENLVIIDIKKVLNFKQALKSSAALVEIEVSGQVHLYRSRYLHLVSDLKVQHWQSLESNNQLDKSTNTLPSHLNYKENIIPSNRSTPLTAINEIPLRAAIIKQSRRMRSNELHYIDHPMLGVLVRVTPVQP